MANVVIDIAAEYTGNKAFRQAESATDKLTRSVKNLAKTVGLAFSTAAIINFGKASVRASLEAQAQQQRLAALLKVTNGVTQDQVNILMPKQLLWRRLALYLVAMSRRFNRNLQPLIYNFLLLKLLLQQSLIM